MANSKIFLAQYSYGEYSDRTDKVAFASHDEAKVDAWVAKYNRILESYQSQINKAYQALVSYRNTLPFDQQHSFWRDPKHQAVGIKHSKIMEFNKAYKVSHNII
ncbi:hypothetical protein MA9V2_149 [Chryseobacterium phage MA9V-2]|nr:hypothetical protein MA9V2_149 [Chryseobacterium phage MA9V-2]